ncbi:hypothetical protein Tco_0861330 [Tanacetum coccineum]|uniref:Reverse transcriptase domain-containing protein n=1 Tax=Tanacetum coccineum TaxID=301880 RepID=A0ABQ5BIA9_9ASTR
MNSVNLYILLFSNGFMESFIPRVDRSNFFPITVEFKAACTYNNLLLKVNVLPLKRRDAPPKFRHYKEPIAGEQEKDYQVKVFFICKRGPKDSDALEKEKKGLIFKVDFEKAYDSINWSFLLGIRNKMVFGVKWHKWVEVCLQSSRMSTLANGSPTTEFGLERGLNKIVNEAVEKEDYGLQVNYNKSKIYGIGENEVKLMDMAGWMGCGVEDFPFMYLGLLIGENMRQISAWNLDVEKFKSRLDDWKGKTMSFPEGESNIDQNGSRWLGIVLLFDVPCAFERENSRGDFRGRVKVYELGLLEAFMGIGDEMDGMGFKFTSSCRGVLGDGNDIRFRTDRWVDDSVSPYYSMLMLWAQAQF